MLCMCNRAFLALDGHELLVERSLITLVIKPTFVNHSAACWQFLSKIVWFVSLITIYPVLNVLAFVFCISMLYWLHLNIFFYFPKSTPHIVCVATTCLYPCSLKPSRCLRRRRKRLWWDTSRIKLKSKVFQVIHLHYTGQLFQVSSKE